MWFQMVLMVPVLLPTLVVKTVTCTNATNSDVFFKYSGHVEANMYSPPETYRSPSIETTHAAPVTVHSSPPTVYHRPSTTRSTTPQNPIEVETESVVFVPNAPPVVREEDEEEERRGFKIQDLLEKSRMNDVMDKNYRVETQPPDEIVFVAHKNQDHLQDRSKEDTKERKKHKKKSKEEPTTPPTLDCNNLDCNNTIKAVCGVKNIDRKWQYRLFLNDCYFRKVNCNFKYESSRYSEVPKERCEKIGGHLAERPFSFRPRYYDNTKSKKNLNARRSFSSRRSMAMSVNGQFCSHPCPISCPEDYEPECAVSATGQRKVFMNHCKLDDNSCLFAVVWHKRPLSECVGGKKADMRQNRFFIGWMQRVGILDNKGRLVLD